MIAAGLLMLVVQHAGHMPAMAMPPAPAKADPCPPEHAAMGHCKPAAPSPARAPIMPVETDGPAGDMSPPAAPAVTYADARWGADAMRSSRTQFFAEHGGSKFAQVMISLAELQIRDGRDGFRWDGEAWFGGDIDRLVVKSEGRAGFGRGVDDAEVQALWSHAVGPYFNLKSGVRYDFEPKPARAYGTVGFEGLAPYWVQVGGAIFLSDKGALLARAEAYYDQRITQRLILQPRAELNFASQDDRRRRVGSGISDLEFGLRLRYELTREFAPYVGVSWDRKLGDTAGFVRAAGEGVSDTSLVAGVRFWF